MKNLLLLLSFSLCIGTYAQKTVVTKTSTTVKDKNGNVIKADSTSTSATIIPDTVKIAVHDTVLIYRDTCYNPVPPPSSLKFVLDTIPFSDNDYAAPLRGANAFYNDWSSSIRVAFPYTPPMDNETRYSWTQLQTTQGVYNWSALTATLNDCIAKNQKLSFGIMILEPGSTTSITIGSSKSNYPVFVHDLMQSESVKDYQATVNGTSLWCPNWNSPSLLAQVKILLNAIAKYISTGSNAGVPYSKVVSKIYIGIFGEWAEWHNSGITEAAGTHATEATLKSFIDAHISAFPDYPLFGNVSVFWDKYSYASTAYYLLTTNTNAGAIGWANHHLGDNSSYYEYMDRNNTMVYNGIAIKPLIFAQYKKAIIGGEPINFNSSGNGNGTYPTFVQYVKDFGVSDFNNSYNPNNPTGSANIVLASKTAGYRVQVKSVTVSGNSIVAEWSNIGVAPVYENWDVYFRINGVDYKSAFVLKLFQPGFILFKDTYDVGKINSLSIIIKDPSGYRKPFVLANKKRLADGSYSVF